MANTQQNAGNSSELAGKALRTKPKRHSNTTAVQRRTSTGDEILKAIKDGDIPKPHKTVFQMIAYMSKTNINPNRIDIIITNENDRELKRNTTPYFFVLAAFVTGMSYIIILLDGSGVIGLSDDVVLAICLKIPVEFVGLLYIIARHFFRTDR